MKKRLTIILLFISVLANAQFPINAFPFNETDSLYDFASNQYKLQYHIQRFYDANCLDSFKLFTNSSGPTMQQFYTWPTGTTSKQPLGRPYDLRPVEILAQQYQGGNWVNYIHNVDFKFDNTCLDSFYSSEGWNGSSWYLSVGNKTTATFLSNGDPLTALIKDYDGSTGLWNNLFQKNFYYTSGNQLRSIHYRQWSFGGGPYIDYIDSNYGFSNYTSYCHSTLDSFVTYKKTGASYLPYGKQVTQHYPYDGYMYEYFTHNGTNWVKSMKYEQYYDQHANDSLYKQWNWNVTTLQYDLMTYRTCNNTYDSNGNLIRQELFKNLNSSTPTVLYPYSVQRFSNFFNCGGTATTIHDADHSVKFEISPNPSNGNFCVTLPQEYSHQALLSIVDMTGRKVYEQTIESGKSFIQLNQPKGLYLLSLQQGNQRQIQKIIIE